MTRLYVGNIPYSSNEHDLRAQFEVFGRVSEVRIMTDRDTGRPRGFAFVTMDSGAEAAISSLNDTDFNGRRMLVSVAKERSDRSPRRERHERYSW